MLWLVCAGLIAIPSLVVKIGTWIANLDLESDDYEGDEPY